MIVKDMSDAHIDTDLRHKGAGLSRSLPTVEREGSMKGTLRKLRSGTVRVTAGLI